MFILLVTAVALVAWSLQLMRSAFKLREFSLIFASTLVATSAVGVVMIYVIMGGCVGFLADSSQASFQQLNPSAVVQQIPPQQDSL